MVGKATLKAAFCLGVALVPEQASGAASSLRGQRQSGQRAQVLAVETVRSNRSTGSFYDGFSEVACDVDASPEAERVYFKDHACGELPSCRLKELPMQPRLCFDFCRQYENTKFFGIAHGTDCYCAGYFTPASTGGQGECSFHCEGDQKQMCGGPDKSSLFEMHMCGNSQSEAQLAQEITATAGAKAGAALENATAVVGKLRGLADAWTPGVCSMQPEGGRICAYNAQWGTFADKIGDSAMKVAFAANLSITAAAALTEATGAAAGNASDAGAQSGMELATRPVNDAAAKLQGITAMLTLTLGAVAGPFADDVPLASFDAVFTALGATSDGWHAVCALVPVAGASYAAVAEDSPARCGNDCLSKSTGTESCVGFNYQYKDGLATCQLLTAGGLVQPTINKAVPIFEVSESKMSAMGITSMGCYATGAFLQGHPRGPLKAEVLREITA